MLAKVGKRSVIDYRAEKAGPASDRAERIDRVLSRPQRGMRCFWIGSAPAGLMTVGVGAV
jgi:hypothetical protein